MRILHIISQRPDSTGSGIYLQEILRCARLADHTNHLIAGISDNSAEPLIDRQDVELCQYLRFETSTLHFPIPGMSDVMPYKSSCFSQLDSNQVGLYLNAFSHVIEKSIKVFKPDIIHSHHLWLVSSLLKDIAPQIPVVTSCHGSDLRQFRTCQNFQHQVRTGCAKIDHIFALSEAQKLDIIKLYAINEEKISVIGAGFNSTHFNTPSPNIKPPATHCSFLYAGKLSYAKGVPYLLQACEKITHKNWHLDIVGSGTGREHDDCIQIMHRLGGNITHRGTVTQRELAQYMQKADIFVLPSLFEGMPLVVLEALACRCKIISTSLPGVLEIMQKTRHSPIHIVPLPQLHSIDKLHPTEARHFIDTLQQSLSELSNIFLTTPHDRDSHEPDIEHFLWENVYDRIAQQYKRIMRKYS